MNGAGTLSRMSVIPCIMTGANLILGFGATLMIAQAASGRGSFTIAAWMIFAAAVMDGLDGYVARKLRAASDFGAQFDSLADLVSFGVAPALLIHVWILGSSISLYSIIPAMMVVASAVRLVKYNLTASGMRNGHFNGMPTTMAGLLTASLVVVFHQLNIANASTSLISTTGTSKIIALIILAVVLMNSLLMVSNVKFATFDTFFFRGSNTPVRIAISLLILASVVFYPGQAIIFIGLIYICESLMRYSWIKPEKQRGI